MCIGIIVRVNNEGRVHYSFLLMILGLVMLLFVMNLDNRIVVMTKDKVDNALTIAAFSGSVCDRQRMVDSMKVHKEKFDDKVEYDFEQMFGATQILIDVTRAEEIVSDVFLANVTGENDSFGMADDFKICSVIVYNVGNGLKIHRFENGQEYYDELAEYGEGNYVYSPNGVCIDKTSIYVKVEFSVRGILNQKKRVFLEKCIALKFANE